MVKLCFCYRQHFYPVLWPGALISNHSTTQQKWCRNNSNNPQLWWDSCLLLANWSFGTHNKTHIFLATNLLFFCFLYLCCPVKWLSLQMNLKKRKKNIVLRAEWKKINTNHQKQPDAHTVGLHTITTLQPTTLVIIVSVDYPQYIGAACVCSQSLESYKSRFNDYSSFPLLNTVLLSKLINQSLFWSSHIPGSKT